MSEMHVEPDAVPEVIPDVTPEHVVDETPADNLSERVDRIENTVTDLAETVSGLVTPALPDAVVEDNEDDEQDETPVSVPWTHRGFGHKS